MNYSFWEKKFIQTPMDLTIIGSGIVGLSTAISIKEKQPWLTVKILERGSLPYGASTKNAGFSCFGSVSEILDDIQQIGEEQTMEIVKMRYQGLKILKSRVQPQVMEYQHHGGTELFRKSDNILKEQCIDSIAYCNQLMHSHLDISHCYSLVKNHKLTTYDTDAIYNESEGIINPVAMMNALSRKAVDLGISVVYGINITEVDRQNKVIKTDQHLIIEYKRLIVCTNGFAAALFPELEVVPARNQVLITEKLDNNPLDSGYHMDKGYVYFRNYEGRILLGGGRNLDHAGESTDQFGHTALIQRYLKKILEELYPGASSKIYHWWSGILGIGPSKYPICKWVDEDIIAGVRLGGMGVAIGSYLGEKLACEVIKS